MTERPGFQAMLDLNHGAGMGPGICYRFSSEVNAVTRWGDFFDRDSDFDQRTLKMNLCSRIVSVAAFILIASFTGCGSSTEGVVIEPEQHRTQAEYDAMQKESEDAMKNYPN